MKGFNKKLVKNFSYLSVLQIVNLFLPLILYPFLILKLGLEVYGKIIYANAIISYFLVIVNYGFNISGTKLIAESRADLGKTVAITMSIYCSKALLLLLSMLCLSTASLFIPFIRENILLIVLTSLILVGDLLTPTWYFQGKEDLGLSTWVTVSSKVTVFVTTIIVIDSPDDYLIVPGITGFGSIISGLIISNFLLKDINVGNLKVSSLEVKKALLEGFSFFLSRFFVTVRERVAMIVVGGVLGFKYVSYLDLIQKIINTLLIPVEMLNTVVYPRISMTKKSIFAYQSMGIAFAYSIGFYILLVYFPYHEIPLFSKYSELKEVTGLFPLFGLSIPLQTIIYFTGNTILVVYGYSKEFNFSTIIGGIFYLALLSFGYIYKISMVWLGVSTVLSYFIIIVIRLYYFEKYKLWNRNG